MIDVSILIVHYKTLQLTTDCIRSVYALTKEVSFEIIVIDNDSQDGAAEAITKEFSAIKWLNTGYNAGFGRANNVGIRAAKGRYVLLLNSDTLLIDDVISRCAQRMEHQTNVAAAGAMQLDAQQQPRFFYTKFADILHSFFIVPLGARKLLARLIPPTQYADPEEADWVVGSFKMVRRAAFEKVGMFDEDFFMYAEDAEWSCRLRKAGQLKIFHDCQYIHLEWGSDPTRKREAVSYLNRFYPQIHLSNLVWVRKSFGLGFYLLLILNYLLLVPVIFGWRMAVSLLQFQSPFNNLSNQKAYTRKIMVFMRYFWPIVWNKPHFYKLNQDLAKRSSP